MSDFNPTFGIFITYCFLKSNLALLSFEFTKFDIHLDSNISSLQTKISTIHTDNSALCTLVCAIQFSCYAIDIEEEPRRCTFHSPGYTIEYQVAGTRTLIKKPTTDCSEVTTATGVYTIHGKMKVYCDMTEDSAGWTVFQKRANGSVDFYRSWQEYKDGFGDPAGEYWLGNDNLHVLTSSRTYMLRVEIEDTAGVTGFAEYSSFQIGDEASKYLLSVGTYNGNADNSMAASNGMKFTTYDQDNDVATSIACGSAWQGGFWYKRCGACNPNGPYVALGGMYQKMFWISSKQLQKIVMKLKPTGV